MFLLEGDLSWHIPDEILRNFEFGGDVLRGDESPGDGELDVWPDVGGAFTRGTIHLSSSLQIFQILLKNSNILQNFDIY